MRGKILGIACLALVIMTTAASAEGVTRLESLGWADHVLTLDLDGPYQIRTMILDDPDRVVLDFPNVRSTLSVHDFTGSGAVSGIRVGQNEVAEASGLRCRIVVDLVRKTDFHISESAAGVRIAFSDEAIAGAKGAAMTELPEIVRESEISEPRKMNSISVSSVESDRSPEPAPEPVHVAPAKIQTASVGQMLLGVGGTTGAFVIPSRDRLRAIASGQVETKVISSTPAVSTDETTAVITESSEVEITPFADDQFAGHVTQTDELVEDAILGEVMELAADPVAPLAEAPETVATVTEAPPETPLITESLSLLDWQETAIVEQQNTTQPAPQEMLEVVQGASEAKPVASEDPAEIIGEYLAGGQSEQKVAEQAVAEVVSIEPVQRVKKAPFVMATLAAGMGTNLYPQKMASANVTADKPVQDQEKKSSNVASSGANPTVDSSTWHVETSADIKRSSVLGVKNTGDKDGEKKKGSWTDQIRKARQAGGAFTMDSQTKVKPEAAPISLEMRGAEFKTLLRAFSDFSGQNIISGQDVKGKVSVKLKAVPWFEGLQAVCGAHGFGVHEEFGILRVAPTGVLEQEEMARLTRGKKRTEYEPLVTKMIVLRFAVAGDLTESLQRMLSERGKVDVDARSNTLLITDAEENVDRVIKIAQELDHTVPQVEITARIVDVDYYASRDMGIRWDALNLVSDKANLVGSAVLDGTLLDPIGEVKVGTIRDWGSLSVTLQAMEKENKANVISNPRVMTMDNIEATILVGKKIPLIVADEAGNAITQLTTIGIKLQVTPHINSDGQVMMELHTEVSDLASEATVQGGVIINTHESTSNVMVDDGETAVIAGLIRSSETNLDQKVPFLGKIPLIKHLFGYENSAKKKRELIIFITPRIVPSAGSSALGSAELETFEDDLSLNY